MFTEIYVPFDGSEYAQGALELAVQLAAPLGATVIGSHVYAARLHESRFRALESGLPAPLQKERRLEEQRDIHDSLITGGLELITDGYLSQMAARCAEAQVAFRGVTLEGRNWQALAEDIHARRYGLVVMGALGHGRTDASLVGTVCERVVRRASADVLVVRDLQPPAPAAPIAVCLDGSAQAWGGLELGLTLARITRRPLLAVSAFDPFFHYALFDGLKRALSQTAKELFKFEQQERLHETIIESGLAKIYQSHLDVAASWGRERQHAVEGRLLKGKPAQELLRYARTSRPWLLILGRTGIHGGESLDLGGVTELLLRTAPCNLLIAHRKARPPEAYLAEATIAWSEEGQAKLDKAPAQFRGVAMAAIQRFAMAQGYTVITSAVVDHALAEILPPEARLAMGIGRPGAVTPQTGRRRLELSFRCPSCGHVQPRKRPALCPVCREGGSLFSVVAERQEAHGPAPTSAPAPAGGELAWAPQARELLAALPDYFLQQQLRLAIERRARAEGRKVISRALAAEVLNAPVPGGSEAPAAAPLGEGGEAQDDAPAEPEVRPQG